MFGYKKLPNTASIGLASGLTTGATGLVGRTMISSYLDLEEPHLENITSYLGMIATDPEVTKC